MNEITILVTGAGGGGVGETCMQALRLAETKYKIIATDMNPASIGIFESDKGYIVPAASDSNYINKILEICKKENVKAIVTGSEPELVKISENRQVFLDNGILPLLNTSEVISLCQNKWKTYEFLKQNGFPVPDSKIIETLEDSKWDFNFPVVIKPYVGGGGSRHSYIAQDQEDLDFFVKFMLKYDVVPMVQEYVGDIDEEYTVGVLTSLEEGELIGSIAVKRNIRSGLSSRLKIKSKETGNQLGISTGISQGEINIYPKVLETAEKIALKLGSKGPLNIQCRKKRDKVYTFEINPRFSGTTSIRSLVGYNEIDLTVRKSIFKEQLQKVNYKKGIVMRGLRNVYMSYDKIKEITEKGGKSE